MKVSRRPLPLALIAAALLLGCAALSPTLSLPRAISNVIVVFDITQSMDVSDQAIAGVPASRLDFARAAARRALRELPCGSHVGWAAFSEYRTILLLAPVEVCADYGDLLAALDRIDGRMRWGEASEITKGVFWAVRTAQALEPSPSVIFVTDGQEAPPINAEGVDLFDDFKSGRIHGWLVGAGSDVPQPIPHSDAEGRRIGFWHADEVMQIPDDPRSHEELSAVHEAHLKALAARVGFDYVRLDAPDALGQAMRDPRLAQRERAPTNIAWLPLGAALLCLAWHYRPQVARWASIRA
jgi:mxaL protein